jgi:hypothetical protein
MKTSKLKRLVSYLRNCFRRTKPKQSRKTSEKKTLEAYLKYVFRTTEPDPRRIEAALNRAHEIRQFEIRLYWQRNLYMWGFMLALFTAYGYLYQQINNATNATSSAFFLFSITGLGLFTSFAWSHLEIGSRSWQRNWEYHIDFLERAAGEDLHKTVIGKRMTFFSLNKILGSLIIAVYYVWLILIHLAGLEFFNFLREFFGYEPLPRDSDTFICINLVIFALVLSVYVLLICIKRIWNTSFQTLPENGVDKNIDTIFHRSIPEISLPKRGK